MTGPALWLTEAAAAGTTKMRVKMADAVATAKLVGTVRGRLGAGARRGQRPLRRGRPGLDPGPPRRRHGRQHRASEDHSLTQGTAGWAALHVNQATGEVTG